MHWAEVLLKTTVWSAMPHSVQLDSVMHGMYAARLTALRALCGAGAH